MSEREFLELLNLYLDREITPADADRLEREIRADPGRHRTYLQYCRMQQAVRLLGTADGLREADRSRPAAALVRRQIWPGWVWTGAMAAAAIVVLAVATRRSGVSATSPDARLVAEPVSRGSSGAGQPASLALSGDALLLSSFPRQGSAPQVHEDQFNWMRQFQLVSLESRIGAPQPILPSVAPQPAVPAAASRPTGEDATELAAFKFVK
jgi:hypothetical protein